ncbi:MAG TPA: DUF421 domain-containing protein [Bacillota bacterium]|nr:DUF421 domain-containing protein [Bacillota bacterium]
MSILTVTLKILLGLVLLFALTKILGKTQISQITPFDFISSIVMGEIFVHAVFDEKHSLLEMAYPIVLWGVLIYLIELLAEKNLKLRCFFEGKPSVLIRNGQIDRQEMKRNKINLNQLLNLLRQNNVFSITEVKYAILEMNGFLSVLKNAPDATPTRKDLNLPDTPVNLPVTLVIDGEVLTDNLKLCGFDQTHLEEQLRQQNITNVKKVFYAEWKPDTGLYVSQK